MQSCPLTKLPSAPFYRSVFYEKLSVLLIESWQRETSFPEEQLTIVDKDLCVLT